jgi:hypothetical protein
MVTVLWVVNIVLFPVCREQGPVEKYPSGMIEETWLVSKRKLSARLQALTLV